MCGGSNCYLTFIHADGAYFNSMLKHALEGIIVEDLSRNSKFEIGTPIHGLYFQSSVILAVISVAQNSPSISPVSGSTSTLR